MKNIYALQHLRSCSLSFQNNRSLIKLLLVSMFILFQSHLFAQTSASIAWQKSLGGSEGEISTYVQQTSDGGFFAGGHSRSDNDDVSGNHGGDDYWCVKLDASGNIQWQKSFGGSDDEHSRASCQTADGGFIMVGESNSSDGDVTQNHGESDYWIVKMDANGNLDWQTSLGGSEVEIANAVQQTFDGGYIVGGYAESTDGDVVGNHGDEDNWIVKLDTYGNVVWKKCYGGSDGDYCYYVRQTSDGGYVTGSASLSTDGDVTGNHGDDDYWVTKLDSSGNITWENSYGGSGDDRINSVQQTTDGGFVVAGSSNSTDFDVTDNHGGRDGWIIKLDANGNLLWEKSLGSSENDAAMAIKQTSDGGYVVAGYVGADDGQVTDFHGVRDYWVVKLDANGNLLWQKAMGGSDREQPNSIDVTTDGEIIVSGFSASVDDDITGNHGGWDYWVVRLTCNQTYYADADGDLYGDATNTLLACTTPNGFVSDNTDCDDNNVDVNPEALEIPNNGIDDNCNGEIDEFGVGINSIGTLQITLSVFPNPTDGAFSLLVKLSDEGSAPIQIQVLNLLGQTIYSEKTNLDKGMLMKKLHLADAMSQGTYLVKIISGDRVYSSVINCVK